MKERSVLDGPNFRMLATLPTPPYGSCFWTHGPDLTRRLLSQSPAPAPPPCTAATASQQTPISLIQEDQPDGGSRVSGTINTERERESQQRGQEL